MYTLHAPAMFYVQGLLINTEEALDSVDWNPLLRLSQLQLNDIMSPPHSPSTLSYSILLTLKACGQSVECLQ